MTDVYIVALSVIGYLIAAPGLAVALNLLLPRVTERAYLRLERTRGASFAVGFVASGTVALWVAILMAIGAGPTQAMAIVSVVIALGIYAIGAAGMSRLLGERLGNLSGSDSPVADIARGAVALELACFVPVVGWFLFTPLIVMTTMGASIFGLLGWAPKDRSYTVSEDQQNHEDVTMHASAGATQFELG